MKNMITIGGHKTTERKAVNAIIRCYNDSRLDNEGVDWYWEAREFARELSAESGIELSKVVGVIAALSPQKSWDENKKLARRFVVEGQYYGNTPVMNQKAVDILNGAPILKTLRGLKISSFFKNIIDPIANEAVTIDRHAICIAYGKVLPSLQMTAKNYKALEQAYLKAADKLGIKGHELQAITWVKWRQLK